MTGPRSFVEVLRARAAGPGAARGYRFLVDGETLEERLDYAELDRRARGLAAVLLERGAAGERALLVFPAGLDYIVALFGCLYAGAIAVPVVAPDPLRPRPGVEHMLRVARVVTARFALSSAKLLPRLAELVAGTAAATSLEWLDTDAPPGAEHAWRAPLPDDNRPALLQFTSGSTSEPRGVRVSHRNLVANAAFIREAFAISATSRGVSWLPPHHDMGLMGGILEPMFVGADTLLLSPQAFLERPVRFLQAITRFRATTCGAPNFAYDLLARRVSEASKAQLDLSSWSVAFCGAEPVRAETLRRFAQAFAGCGFRPQAFLPCYGLAEATLLVTAVAPAQAPRELRLEPAALERGLVAPAPERAVAARTLVSCGRPPAGVRVRVVDPDTRRAFGEGQVGEIWVKSEGVADGYWGDPSATALVFDAAIEPDERGYLRTGDLGFLDDGELFLAGRLKDLIIVSGRNLFPQDLEASLEAGHPAVRPGRSVAFSAEIDGDERLVVAAEVVRGVKQKADEIAEALRRVVANEHGVLPHTVVLLEPRELPRTSSGKLRRPLCRRLFLDGRLGWWCSTSGAQGSS